MYTFQEYIPQKRDHSLYDYYAIEFADSVEPKEVARALNAEYLEPVGDLGYHLFRQPKSSADLVVGEILTGLASYKHNNTSKLSKRDLDTLSLVTAFEKQVPTQHLFKRAVISDPRDDDQIYEKLGIFDPGFPKQWHLHNNYYPGHDLNVTGIWAQGITGKGVTVAVLDDGLDFTSDDLRDNFSFDGSFDFNNHTKLPYPWKSDDLHGTKCASEIAGVRNDICGIGVAYEAKVAGIRILSGKLTSADEAMAILYQNQLNDIYSCSWGPSDNGKTMNGPKGMIEKSFEKGVKEGRGGKGSIFIFATGNGNRVGDNCNFDGYTNSPYTISIGGIDWLNKQGDYSESCSANFAVTYSSGSGKGIFTSTPHQSCTDRFSGTSAAAPLVSGVMALALSVRPELGWRDAQNLLIKTSVPINLDHPSWQTTASGRLYSHTFGYGKVDAFRLVEEAKKIPLVGGNTKLHLPRIDVERNIPEDDEGLYSTVSVTKEHLLALEFKRLEHVTVTINLNHQRRGDVEVELISPHGIISVLSPGRRKDDSVEGFENWQFMSIAHWEEDPIGDWTLIVRDRNLNYQTGYFINWQLALWGEKAAITQTSSVISTPTFTLAKPTLGTTVEQVVSAFRTVTHVVEVTETLTKTVDVSVTGLSKIQLHKEPEELESSVDSTLAANAQKVSNAIAGVEGSWETLSSSPNHASKIVVGALIGFMVLIAIVVALWIRRRRRYSALPSKEQEAYSSTDLLDAFHADSSSRQSVDEKVYEGGHSGYASLPTQSNYSPLQDAKLLADEAAEH